MATASNNPSSTTTHTELDARAVASAQAVATPGGDLDGRVVSIEEFGESGSGPEVLRRRGIHLNAVIAAAHATLAAPALVTT